MVLNDLKLIAALLSTASDTFGNHCCNDFDLTALLPNVEDRRDLMRRMHEWNGDPEEFDASSSYEDVADFFLMGYFADLLMKQQPSTLDLIVQYELSIIKCSHGWMVGKAADNMNSIGGHYADEETGCVDGYLIDFAVASTPSEAIYKAVEIQQQKVRETD